MENAKVYLLDVEGTVAPLSLTTGQLFPYARRHLPYFLRDNSGNFEVRADLELLQQEAAAEADPDAPKWLGTVRSGGLLNTPEGHLQACLYLSWLMDRDRKSTALKSLQGKIWKAGFESGELKGTLFDDVPEAIARWSAKGKVAIYSSGSVEAQRLFFRHSTGGDLTPLISAYFDTRTGPKMEAASYAAIARAMHVDPGEAVFFSDVVNELDAARAAGMQTRLVLREGNAPVQDARGHESVLSLTAS